MIFIADQFTSNRPISAPCLSASADLRRSSIRVWSFFIHQGRISPTQRYWPCMLNIFTGMNLYLQRSSMARTSLRPSLRCSEWNPSCAFYSRWLSGSIYYQFAIILLFRPFLKSEFEESAISPCTFCVKSANNVCSLIRSFANLYTMRRMCFVVPYIALASTTIHVADVSDAAINQLTRQSLTTLRETSNDTMFISFLLKLTKFVDSEYSM